jgi:hypothetical protein
MVTIPRVTAGDDHVCGGGHGRLPAGSDVSDMFGVCRLRIIVILARQREAYDEYRAAVRVIAAWM